MPNGVGADTPEGPRIYIGRTVEGVSLEPEECAVFTLDGNLTLFAGDEAGLEAAGEAYASRAPYQWRVPGDKLAAIAAAVGPSVELAGVTYLRGRADVHRAYLRSHETVPGETLAKALADPRRFAMLQQIAASRECVGCSALDAHQELSPATISHQIKELAEAGLVDVQRDGRCASLTLHRDTWESYLAQLAKL